jgi:hypothetical protein
MTYYGFLMFVGLVTTAQPTFRNRYVVDFIMPGFSVNDFLQLYQF